jgi:hypothetical protein
VRRVHFLSARSTVEAIVDEREEHAEEERSVAVCSVTVSTERGLELQREIQGMDGWCPGGDIDLERPEPAAAEENGIEGPDRSHSHYSSKQLAVKGCS